MGKAVSLLKVECCFSLADSDVSNQNVLAKMLWKIFPRNGVLVIKETAALRKKVQLLAFKPSK